MNRARVVPIVALFVALLAAAIACGDDGSTPGENFGGGENPDGPAEDVAGVWTGTYASSAGTRSGAFCLDLDQDGRALTGTVSYEGEPVLRVGGTIANDRMAIVWSPQTGGAGSVTPASDASLQFITGGTLTGDVSNGDFTGVWQSLDSDSGTWSATSSDAEACA